MKNFELLPTVSFLLILIFDHLLLDVIKGFIVSHKNFFFKLPFCHFNFLIYETRWTSSLIFIRFDAGMFFYVVFLTYISPSKGL